LVQSAVVKHLPGNEAEKEEVDNKNEMKLGWTIEILRVFLKTFFPLAVKQVNEVQWKDPSYILVENKNC